MYKIQIIGRLTADAVIKDKDDKKIITYSVASSNTEKDTQYYRCSKFVDQLPNNIESYKKGAQVFLEGRPSINTYVNSEGVSVSGFDVSLQTMMILAKSNQESAPGTNESNVGGNENQV